MNLTETHILVKALSATQSPVTITDCAQPDNPIVYCNDAFLQLTGYSRSDVIGKNCRFLQGHDTDPDQVTKLRDAIRAKRDVAVTFKNYTKEGRAFWNNLQVSPVYGNDGSVSHFIGLQVDVTSQIEQEQARARAKQLEMETRILAMEKERLLKINEAKDDFIAVASHQLRTPATNVKQYLGMLREGMLGEFSEQQSNAIEVAYSNNDRQIKIIDDLLRIARIDTGKVVLERSDVDLGALLKTLAESFKYRLIDSDQHLDISVPDKPVHIDIDRDLVFTVLENIVDNAIKYSRGRGTISLTLTKKGRTVEIAVSDTGIGMSEADMEKIFQKFVRANSRTSKNIGGTGLGLYWVKTVLDMHGAAVRVASEIGKGTTFTLTFKQAVKSKPRRKPVI